MLEHTSNEQFADETLFRAALCQVFDSIFRAFSFPVATSLSMRTMANNMLPVDVPMSRVKFNVNTEYAYLQNFKILQSTPHRPDKSFFVPSNLPFVRA